jgi:HK97 family phage prohead protease
MPTKNVAIKIKATAADDASLGEGQFVALASVFNNVDAVGDVVKPGAFADDLKTWAASGDVIPVYWGHRMDDPNLCVGSVIEASETDDGLQVKAQLDLDNPMGKQVYRLLKGRRVSRMSFAYDIVDSGHGEMDGQDVYELRKLKIHEVSVVQVPANPAAVVQEVKAAADRRREALARKDADPAVIALVSQVDQCVDDALASLTAADAGMDALLVLLNIPDLPDSDADDDDAAKRARALLKSGRTLSAKNEGALKGALEKITAGTADIKSVLASIDSSSDDGKANPAQPATTEEPDGAKVDAPARPGPASFRLRSDLASWDAEVEALSAA